MEAWPPGSLDINPFDYLKCGVSRRGINRSSHKKNSPWSPPSWRSSATSLGRQPRGPWTPFLSRLDNARKVSKFIRRMRRKYLSVCEEYSKLGLFAVHKIVSICAEVFKCIRRVRGKDLCVHGEDIQMCISWLIIIQILIFLKLLSNYTIWDRLSQKTISRYCTFNMVGRGSKRDVVYIPWLTKSALVYKRGGGLP